MLKIHNLLIINSTEIILIRFHLLQTVLNKLELLESNMVNNFETRRDIFHKFYSLLLQQHFFIQSFITTDCCRFLYHHVWYIYDIIAVTVFYYNRLLQVFVASSLVQV